MHFMKYKLIWGPSSYLLCIWFVRMNMCWCPIYKGECLFFIFNGYYVCSWNRSESLNVEFIHSLLKVENSKPFLPDITRDLSLGRVNEGTKAKGKTTDRILMSGIFNWVAERKIEGGRKKGIGTRRKHSHKWCNHNLIEKRVEPWLKTHPCWR